MQQAAGLAGLLWAQRSPRSSEVILKRVSGLGSRGTASDPCLFPPKHQHSAPPHATYVVLVLYGLAREVQHGPRHDPLTEEVANLKVGG